MYPVFYEINRTRAMCISEINLTRTMCINEINQSRRLFVNEINLTRMMFESRVKQLEQKVCENTTDLSVANQKIDLLQSFCIANGLEVPFWNSAYPPPADVSSMEALSAATAVSCANFVLEEEKDGVVPMDVDSEADASEADAEYTDIMNSITDYGDAYAYGDGGDNVDFIQVPYYDEEDATYYDEDSEEEDESSYDP